MAPAGLIAKVFAITSAVAAARLLIVAASSVAKDFSR